MDITIKQEPLDDIDSNPGSRSLGVEARSRAGSGFTSGQRTKKNLEENYQNVRVKREPGDILPQGHASKSRGLLKSKDEYVWSDGQDSDGSKEESRHPSSTCRTTRRTNDLKYDSLKKRTAQTGNQLRYKNGYNCPVCFKYMANKTKMKIHLRCHNSTGLSLSQSLLVKNINVATKRSNTVENIALDTTSSGNYKCHFCSCCFSKSSQLHIHLRSHNSEGFGQTVFGSSTEDLSQHNRSSTGRKKKCTASINVSNKDDVVPSFCMRDEGSNQWTCVICAKSFTTVGKLTIHQRCHNSIEAPIIFKCSRCGKTTKTESELKAHVKECQNSRPFQCTLCPKAFRRAFHLWEHKKTHTGDKPFSCLVCGKAFSTQLILDSHMSTHSSAELVKCKICKATFKVPYLLSKHVKLKHKSANQMSLENPIKISAASTGRKRTLPVNTQNKMITKDTQKDTEDDFQCDLCEATFSDAVDFANHCQLHVKKERIDPDTAVETSFPRSESILKPTVSISQRDTNKCTASPKGKHTKSGKTVSCRYCGAVLKSSELLKRHEDIHFGEKPVSCDICSKRFTWSGALLYHKLIHNEVKSYTCKYCKISYGKSALLDRHTELQHADHAIYNCDRCNARFKTPVDVNLHEIMAHSEDQNLECWKCRICPVNFTDSKYLREHERMHFDSCDQMEGANNSETMSDDDSDEEENEGNETNSYTQSEIDNFTPIKPVNLKKDLIDQ